MNDDLILLLDEEEDLVFVSDQPMNLSEDDVTREDVLIGKWFHLPNGEKAQGTCDYDSFTLDASAVASDIMSGRTAYARGEMITGTYSFANATQGTATAAEIKIGKTAWVNGVKQTGMWVPKATLQKSENVTLAINNIYIPAGTYAKNVTFTVPVIATNIYSTSMQSASNVQFKRQSGASVNIFSYVSCSSSSGTGLIAIQYTGSSSTITILSNEYYINIGTARGTFIRANIS